MSNLKFIIGRNIRKIRNSANPKITQEELAARVKIRVESVSKFENGHIYPSVSLLEKMAEALDVTPARLLYDPDNHKKAEALITEVNTFKKLDKLNEQNYTMVMSFAEFLLAKQDR